MYKLLNFEKENFTKYILMFHLVHCTTYIVRWQFFMAKRSKYKLLIKLNFLRRLLTYHFYTAWFIWYNFYMPVFLRCVMLDGLPVYVCYSVHPSFTLHTLTQKSCHQFFVKLQWIFSFYWCDLLSVSVSFLLISVYFRFFIFWVTGLN